MDTNKEIIIDMIREDVREMKADIKELLSFKWKIIGGSVVLSTFASVFITFLGKLE